MIPKELGIMLIIAAIVVTFLYSKMVLIWRDVMIEQNERRRKDMGITWVACDERLPEHLQTVWLSNAEKQWVCLGCLVENDDQSESEYNYHWAEGNGVVYVENGVIVSECESDDLDVTHWCALPKPPCC